ncbi:MAG: hypothetical protein PHS53_04700 [Candidatus Pacebacteria bacterium]|nr:hypothetical protein [Candidatus Paceibacterota bacterium]
MQEKSLLKKDRLILLNEFFFNFHFFFTLGRCAVAHSVLCKNCGWVEAEHEILAETLLSNTERGRELRKEDEEKTRKKSRRKLSLKECVEGPWYTPQNKKKGRLTEKEKKQNEEREKRERARRSELEDANMG